MARCAAFQRLIRTTRFARFCDRNGLSTKEGIERAVALEAASAERGTSRREFLAGAAATAAVSPQSAGNRRFTVSAGEISAVVIVAARGAWSGRAVMPAAIPPSPAAPTTARQASIRPLKRTTRPRMPLTPARSPIPPYCGETERNYGLPGTFSRLVFLLHDLQSRIGALLMPP